MVSYKQDHTIYTVPCLAFLSKQHVMDVFHVISYRSACFLKVFFSAVSVDNAMEVFIETELSC